MILDNVSALTRQNRIYEKKQNVYNSLPVKPKNSLKIAFSGNVLGAKTISEEMAFNIAQRIEFKNLYENLPDVIKSLMPANGNFKHLESILSSELIKKIKAPEVSQNFQKAEKAFRKIVVNIEKSDNVPSIIKEINSPKIKDYIISNLSHESNIVDLLGEITDPTLKASKVSQVAELSRFFAEHIDKIAPHIEPEKNDELILRICKELKEDKDQNIYNFQLAPYIKDNDKRYEIFSEAAENILINDEDHVSFGKNLVETLSKLPKNDKYNPLKKKVVKNFLDSSHIYDFVKGDVKKNLYMLGDNDITKISLDSILQDDILVTPSEIKNVISSLSSEEDKLLYITKMLNSESYSLSEKAIDSISLLKDSNKQEELITNLLHNGKEWFSKRNAASGIYLIKDDAKRQACLNYLVTDLGDYYAEPLYNSLIKIEDSEYLNKFSKEVTERFKLPDPSKKQPDLDLNIEPAKMALPVNLNRMNSSEFSELVKAINDSEFSEQLIPLYKELAEKSPKELPNVQLIPIYDNYICAGKAPSEFSKIFDDYKYLNKTFLDNFEKFNHAEIRQLKTEIDSIKNLGTIFSKVDINNESELLKDLNQIKQESHGQKLKDHFITQITKNLEKDGFSEELNLKIQTFFSECLPDIKVDDLTLEQYKNILKTPFEKKHSGQLLSIFIDTHKNMAIKQGDIFDKSYRQNLNVISLANRGLIIEGQLKNKNENLFHAIESIQEHPDLLNVVSRASRELCIDVINYTKLLEIANGYASVGSNEKFIQKTTNMLDNKKFDLHDLSLDFMKIIGQKCGMSSDEVEKIDSKVMEKWDIDNFPTFAIAMKNLDEKHAEWLKALFKTNVNNDYWQYIFKKDTDIGKANYETSKIFKENGLNYKKWLKPTIEPARIIFGNPESLEQRTNNINKSLVSDINELFDSKRIKELLSAHIASIGCKIDDGVLKSIDGKELNASDLLANTRLINKFMNKHWESDEVKNNANLLTMKDHLKQRISDFSTIIKSDFSKEPELVTAQIWDRNPGTGLFQGTYAQCCTALDGGSKEQAIISMVHTTNQILEFKNSLGENIGNGELYWAINKKNKDPFLVVNNIELNSKYSGGREVIEPVINYLKAYTKEITGKENVKIYAGQNYNKVEFNSYTTETVPNVKVLGSVVDNRLKLDSLGKGVFEDSMIKDHKNIELYRLI